MLGSLISAGGSLLGGLFGRNSAKKAQAAQQEYDKPINVRARYEEAGINPLLAFGGGVVGQSQPVSTQNYMGSAIADASMMVAQKLTESSEEKEVINKLATDNAKLQKDLQAATLRPKVPGIYSTLPVAESVMKPRLDNEEGQSIGPPNPYVRLYNPTANKWVTVYKGAADRLGLKNGDTIIAEDYEAIFGDVGAEIVNLPNMLNELFGFGRAVRGEKPLSAPPGRVHAGQKARSSRGSSVRYPR